MALRKQPLIFAIVYKVLLLKRQKTKWETGDRGWVWERITKPGFKLKFPEAQLHQMLDHCPLAYRLQLSLVVLIEIHAIGNFAWGQKISAHRFCDVSKVCNMDLRHLPSVWKWLLGEMCLINAISQPICTYFTRWLIRTLSLVRFCMISLDPSDG